MLAVSILQLLAACLERMGSSPQQQAAPFGGASASGSGSGSQGSTAAASAWRSQVDSAKCSFTVLLPPGSPLSALLSSSLHPDARWVQPSRGAMDALCPALWQQLQLQVAAVLEQAAGSAGTPGTAGTAGGCSLAEPAAAKQSSTQQQGTVQQKQQQEQQDQEQQQQVKVEVARAMGTLRCANLSCTNVTRPSEASLLSRRCGGCGQVRHCSVECSRQDWRQHKRVCKLLAGS